MLRVLNQFWENPNGKGLPALELFLYHIYALGQAMSLVPYQSIQLSGREDVVGDQGNATNPILVSNARMHVWAWGLGGRTSRLGVGIAVCGCICVVARVVLGVYLGFRKEVSPTEIVVAALQGGSCGDLMRDEGAAKRLGSVRLRIKDCDGGSLGGGSCEKVRRRGVRFERPWLGSEEP